MRIIAVGILALLATVLPSYAQRRSTAPFADLDRQVKEQAGGWDGDKSVLSPIFDKERRRLADGFVPELLKYLEGDVEKHYWVSSFLEWPGYLHGNKPLPHLSLLIRQQALALLCLAVGQTKTALGEPCRSMYSLPFKAIPLASRSWGGHTRTWRSKCWSRIRIFGRPIFLRSVKLRLKHTRQFRQPSRALSRRHLTTPPRTDQKRGSPQVS